MYRIVQSIQPEQPTLAIGSTLTLETPRFYGVMKPTIFATQ